MSLYFFDIDAVNDAVEKIAHEIWIEEGRPEGRGEAHWREAQEIYWSQQRTWVFLASDRKHHRARRL